MGESKCGAITTTTGPKGRRNPKFPLRRGGSPTSGVTGRWVPANNCKNIELDLIKYFFAYISRLTALKRESVWPWPAWWKIWVSLRNCKKLLLRSHLFCSPPSSSSDIMDKRCFRRRGSLHFLWFFYSTARPLPIPSFSPLSTEKQEQSMVYHSFGRSSKNTWFLNHIFKSTLFKTPPIKQNYNNLNHSKTPQATETRSKKVGGGGKKGGRRNLIKFLRVGGRRAKRPLPPSPLSPSFFIFPGKKQNSFERKRKLSL